MAVDVPLFLFAVTIQPPPKQILLYVDPGKELQLVKPSCDRRGCQVLTLHSLPIAANLVNKKLITQEEIEKIRVPLRGQELEWAKTTISKDTEIMGVLCGSDGGLADAERLQHCLVPHRSNGINPARRDKFLMVEAMRAAGLGAADQLTPSNWDEALSKLRQLGFPVVMKPRRGQGSVMVGLSRDEEHARRMYDALRSSSVSIDQSEISGGGQLVIQEYIQGEEWIVDTVSAAGKHKVLTLWRYDKGEENGVPFMYYCDELRPAEGERESQLMAYACDALDALDWSWGACHLEIKIVEEGEAFRPVLIEINAGRWNGDDFQLIAQVGTGNDPIEATLDAYLDEEAWSHVPHSPPPVLRGHGRLVHLVSSVSGTLAAAPAERHAEYLSSLPSLYRFEPRPSEVGEQIVETIDLTSRAGVAYLLHQDADVVEKDYLALRALQPDLFLVRDNSIE